MELLEPREPLALLEPLEPRVQLARLALLALVEPRAPRVTLEPLAACRPFIALIVDSESDVVVNRFIAISLLTVNVFALKFLQSLLETGHWTASIMLFRLQKFESLEKKS